MRQIGLKLPFVGYSQVAVKNGPFTMLFALLVFSFIPQSVLESVLPQAMLLAVLERPLVNTAGLFYDAYVLALVPLPWN